MNSCVRIKLNFSDITKWSYTATFYGWNVPALMKTAKSRHLTASACTEF